MTKWRGIIEKTKKTKKTKQKQNNLFQFAKEESGRLDNFSSYGFVFLILSDGFLW